MCFLVLSLCVALSSAVRFHQYDVWLETPLQYFAAEIPMMADYDAYYWLRWAREYQEGIFYDNKDGLRFYPDGDTKPETIPLLSLLIAHLSSLLGHSLHKAAIYLVPVLASLFILPLGYYFFRVGYPAAGILGGLIGTFSTEYAIRTSIGWVDTDALNLFFPASASLFILLACQTTRPRIIYLYSCFSGLTLLLFHWWYEKPGFTLVYFAVLIATLLINKVPKRTILISGLLFVICAQPVHLWTGARHLNSFLAVHSGLPSIEILVPEKTAPLTTSSLAFPDLLKTKLEAQRFSVDEVLSSVLDSSILSGIGLIGFVIFVRFHWRMLLPLLPIFLLGLFSFQSGRRFIIFLAPFVGAGYGFLLSTAVQLLLEWARNTCQGEPASDSDQNAQRHREKKERDRNRRDPASIAKSTTWARLHRVANRLSSGPRDRPEIIVYPSLAIFFLSILPQTAISYVPNTIITPGIYASLVGLRDKVPEESAFLTWWDYGYAITEATQVATFHDGGSTSSAKAYFIARGMISNKPRELYDIATFLGSEGYAGILDNSESQQALAHAVHSASPEDVKAPVHFLFTLDMVTKFSTIYSIGAWDGKRLGPNRGYGELQCGRLRKGVLSCGDISIDLNQGMVNGTRPLKRALWILEGSVLREKYYPVEEGLNLEILLADEKHFFRIYLMSDDVFESNFNQMYLLGAYDQTLYEETYNAFPHSRLFKMKESPQQEAH